MEEAHPLSKYVRTTEPTDAEKKSWADFDAILKDNRVGSSLREAAYEHSTVHFSGEMSGDPWAAGFAMFADDPLFDEWTAAIREYRAECEKRDMAFEQYAVGKEAEVGGGIG